MGVILQSTGDHPGIPAKAQIGGAPVQHHDEAVAKSDQKIDPGEQPKHSGPSARKSEGPGGRAEINDRRVMQWERAATFYFTTFGASWLHPRLFDFESNSGLPSNASFFSL